MSNYTDNFEELVLYLLHREVDDYDWDEKAMEGIQLEADDWEEYLTDKDWTFDGFSAEIFDWGLEVTSSGIEINVRVRIDADGVSVRGTVDR